MNIRPEILEFAEEMEKNMRREDSRLGEGWKKSYRWSVFNQLQASKEKLGLSLRPHTDDNRWDHTRAQRSAANVANYAMMIFWCAGQMGKETPPAEKPAPELVAHENEDSNTLNEPKPLASESPDGGMPEIRKAVDHYSGSGLRRPRK